MAWKPVIFSLNIIHGSAQMVHCYVLPKSCKEDFFGTFIYAFNESSKRESLWEDMKSKKTECPWVVMRDLNCVRRVEERIGAPVRLAEMIPINQCLQFCGLEDIISTGCSFPWNNKQGGDARVFSKLDRILVNEAWVERYGNAAGKFMQEGEFDHTPAILSMYPHFPKGRHPFKYFTMWSLSPHFIELVRRNWQTQINGSKMFSVVRRMKLIKKDLKEE